MKIIGEENFELDEEENVLPAGRKRKSNLNCTTSILDIFCNKHERKEMLFS